MTWYGADTAQLRAYASTVDAAAQHLDSLAERTVTTAAEVTWVGPDSDAFREAVIGILRTDLMSTSAKLRTIHDDLDSQADAQDRTSEPMQSDLLGSRTVDARDLRSPGTSHTSGLGQEISGQDMRNRDPDGRRGRRIRNDERGAEREGSGNLSHDWAGRAILDRYLTGGDDWHLDHDPAWSEYMMDNADNSHGEASLGNRARELNETAASDALKEYLATGDSTSAHSETTNAELDNGEGVVGSQYLHGSNADAGGFEYSSTSTVTPNGDGTFTVRTTPEYTFNDRIDPNPQYTSDTVKSRLAEVLTLGRADPYDISITWGEPVEIVVDAQGNPISRSGWPYN